jgi:hypothetical protein
MGVQGRRVYKVRDYFHFYWIKNQF